MSSLEGSRRRRLARIGLAIGVTGWFNGFTEPNVGGRSAEIQRTLALSDRALAISWFGWPAGMYLASTVGGRLLERIGTRRLLIIGSIVYWGAFSTIGFAASAAWLFLAMFLVGVGNGFFDVAWGRLSPWYQQQRQEESGERAGLVGQLMWAFFSGGSVLAAVATMLAVRMGIPVGWHLAIVGALALAQSLAFAGWLPNLKADPAERAVRKALRKPPRRLRQASVLAFCAALPVGVGYVWASIYLVRLGAHGWVAIAGLLAFTVAETLVRTALGLLSRRYALFREPVRLTVISGAVALAGLGLIVIPGTVGAAIAGFALLAGGNAPITGLVQSAALEVWPEEKDAGAAMITRYVYGGLVLGPVVIGPLSSELGSAATSTPLRIALGMLAILPLTIIALAPSVRGAAVGES